MANQQSPSIKRKPLGQEVTALLKQFVVQGRYKPGERLVEERLAAEIGISRTPVREALHRLEQEGLLSKRPRGGYVVRPLTPEEVEDAIGARAVLEAYAVEIACKRATEEDLAAFEANLRGFGQALEAKDETRLVEYNSEFHELILQACHSEVVYKLLADLEDTVERISRAIASNMKAGDWSVGEHAEIVEAIRGNDPATAARLCRRHIEHGGEYFIEAMRRNELVL